MVRFLLAAVVLAVFAASADAGPLRARRQAASACATPAVAVAPAAAVCETAAVAPRRRGGVVNAVRAVWWLVHPGIFRGGPRAAGGC